MCISGLNHGQTNMMPNPWPCAARNRWQPYAQPHPPNYPPPGHETRFIDSFCHSSSAQRAGASIDVDLGFTHTSDPEQVLSRTEWMRRVRKGENCGDAWVLLSPYDVRVLMRWRQGYLALQESLKNRGIPTSEEIWNPPNAQPEETAGLPKPTSDEIPEARSTGDCAGDANVYPSRRLLPRPIEEGDDLGRLFYILLETMARKGFFGKMNEWKPKKANPKKLLSQYWIQFTKDLDPPWLKMDMIQKSNHLKWWLLKKWSLDPKKQCMRPCSGEKLHRNEMGWAWLEMTDGQLDEVVYEVMGTYASMRMVMSVLDLA